MMVCIGNGPREDIMTENEDVMKRIIAEILKYYRNE